MAARAVCWFPGNPELPFCPAAPPARHQEGSCFLFGWLLCIFCVNSLCSFLPKSVIYSLLKYLSLAAFL